LARSPIRSAEGQAASKRTIDTEKFSAALRRRGIDLDSRRILITSFEGSEQAKDLTLPPNCGGWGRIHYFRRFQRDWLANPLPIDPASHVLGLERLDAIQVQIFQNAICSWRCWYCFVDFDLLSANPRHSALKTVDELLDLFLAEPIRPPIVDLSGGQPDLVPEWVLWFVDSLKARGLEREIYVWSDDNLSNDYLWRFLSQEQVRRLASSPNYGRVGCFKGFDDHSFSFNTGAEPNLFSSQFMLMRRLVAAGFDVYGYATFTSDQDNNLAANMSDFVDRLQSEVHPLFPLRTVPLHILEYTPTGSRMGPEHRRALTIQHDAVAAWTDEINRRFSEEIRSKPIYEHRMAA